MRTMPRCSPTGRITLKVYRVTQQGKYVNGKFIKPERELIEIKGSNVQPNLIWNQMMMLPEGERSKQAIAIYCPKELYMSDEKKDQAKADIIFYDCVYWEVKISMTYKMGVLNHCEAVALRIDDYNEY